MGKAIKDSGAFAQFMNGKTIRMMTRQKEQEIDEAFLYQRVKEAWEYRKRTVDTGSCRLIFGEADFLPGMVVDKFEDVLVVQSLALGIDQLKPLILEQIQKVLSEDGIQIRGIYERSDAKVRKQEAFSKVPMTESISLSNIQHPPAFNALPSPFFNITIAIFVCDPFLRLPCLHQKDYGRCRGFLSDCGAWKSGFGRRRNHCLYSFPVRHERH